MTKVEQARRDLAVQVPGRALLLYLRDGSGTNDG